MKTRVRLNRKLAALAAVVLLAGGGTASAFYFNEPAPVENQVAKSINTAPTQEPVQPAETAQPEPSAQETTAPVEKAPQPDQPTPSENKAKIKRLIDNYTSSKGFSDNYAYAQSYCMDKAIEKKIGYADYDALFDREKFSPLNDLLYGYQINGKLMKLYFDGVSCSVKYVPAESIDR